MLNWVYIDTPLTSPVIFFSYESYTCVHYNLIIYGHNGTPQDIPTIHVKWQSINSKEQAETSWNIYIYTGSVSIFQVYILTDSIIPCNQWFIFT